MAYDDAIPGAAVAVQTRGDFQNFNPHCGNTLWPGDPKGLENLSRYIIRASFSQERMTYIPAGDGPGGQVKVIYRSKGGATCKTFDALDWLAQLTCHIPNRGEQMVRYYGYYSNTCQGRMRVIAFIEDDEVIGKILEHLGLWDTRNHGTPSASPDPFHDFIIDESYCQWPQTD